MNEETVSPVAETQNPAPVLAETPEIAAPETEAEQTRQEQPEETEADRLAKRDARAERRIGRLNADRYRAQAQAEQARAEAEQLRQELAQYRPPAEHEALTPEKVMPIAQQLAQQMREQERTRDSVSAVLSKGKTLEGFDDACNAVNAELPFYDQGKPSAFLRVVLECDAPEKVLHFLGSNPDVASELADLSPTQVARRLDRIERDLAKPPEPKASTAPKQFAPVKSATKDDGGLHDALTTEEWAKRFMKQRRG